MRDDLLPAMASVDWAVSKLPAFEAALEAWLDENIEIAIVDSPPPATHDSVVAREKAELPLAFSVEAGAYINAVRSSLDILVCAIGKRKTEMILNSHALNFPVADSAKDFLAGKYRGFKLIRQLSRDSWSVIENFKPYLGGNNNIWLCHQLDITRKHQRLLSTYTRPSKTHVRGWGLKDIWQPVATGWVCNPGETILGLLLKGAQRPEVYHSTKVCLSEGAANKAGMPGYPIVAAIEAFANVAKAVIAAFDR